MFIRTRTSTFLTNFTQDTQLTGYPGSDPYVVIGGSVAHGTADPTNPFSDIDLKGFFVAPESHYLGLGKVNETIRGKVEFDDVVIESEMHELRKFAGLALSCNPTVIETLFVDPKNYVRVSMYAQRLIDIRHMFLSRKAFQSFNGYAHQQLYKMGTEEESTRKQGAQRKEMIAKHGYNVKNAAHLLRLLYMGIELAETGTITVERPEKDLLLDVKRGTYKIEEVKQMAEQLFETFRELEASGKSDLPEQPDFSVINEAVREIVKEQLNLVYCEE